MQGHVSVCVFVCVMMCKYAYETWNGWCSLYLLLVVVASAAFVQRWRVYAHEPVFVRVDLVSTCPCHSPLCQ
jgi:general stress protein CsbA